MRDFYLVMRYTRHWIHYGILTHIVLCTTIAAAKGLFGG
jgi:hypothetical protein